MTLKPTMHTSDSAPAQRGNRAVALIDSEKVEQSGIGALR